MHKMKWKEYTERYSWLGPVMKQHCRLLSNGLGVSLELRPSQIVEVRSETLTEEKIGSYRFRVDTESHYEKSYIPRWRLGVVGMEKSYCAVYLVQAKHTLPQSWQFGELHAKVHGELHVEVRQGDSFKDILDLASRHDVHPTKIVVVWTDYQLYPVGPVGSGIRQLEHWIQVFEL